MSDTTVEEPERRGIESVTLVLANSFGGRLFPRSRAPGWANTTAAPRP